MIPQACKWSQPRQQWWLKCLSHLQRETKFDWCDQSISIAQQIPTPRGRCAGNQATVRGILRNPVYTGTVYLGRYRVPPSPLSAVSTCARLAASWRPSATAPQEMGSGGPGPSLLSQEQFDQVQAKFAHNQQFDRRNNTAHSYLLRAFVSCGALPSPVWGAASENRICLLHLPRQGPYGHFAVVMRNVTLAIFRPISSTNWSGRIC